MLIVLKKLEERKLHQSVNLFDDLTLHNLFLIVIDVFQLILLLYDVSTGLINNPPSGVNVCRREIPADAVLRAVYQMNENVNNIQRQVSQIAGRLIRIALK